MTNPLNPDGGPFGPPAIPTLVRCLHCDEEYDSYRIEWRVRDGEPRGFWCCPIAGCNGIGFGCDIWPCDPDYRGEDGNPFYTFDGEDDTGKVAAPFLADEVASLNARQAAPGVHPYTCGTDGCGGVLVAGPDGWACPGCDYRQAWASAHHADWSWRDDG